jgi:phage terminase Nu1 subunit (DNA packaging protein)
MLKRDEAPGVSAAQLAALFGVSPRALNRLAEQGIAVRAGPGRFQLAQSVRNYCAHLREQAGLPRTVPIGVLTDLTGISGTAIRDLAARGIVVRDGRGQYRLAESLVGYAAHLRELAQGHGDETAQQRAAGERGRLAAANADIAELKAAALRGELVEAAAVEREWSAILTRLRARLLATPSRAGQRLPHLTPHDLAEMDREIRDALASLSEAEDRERA